MATITNTVTTEQALTIGNAVHAKALGYAAKTGTAIDLVMVTGADAKDLYKLTPINLMNAIRSNLTADEVDGLPLPGSRWNDGGVANNNCDIFQYKDPSASSDAKPKEVSFYVAWSDNTPEGRNVCQELDYCKRIFKTGMRTDDIPEAWKAKYDNPHASELREKYLSGRRDTIRGAYKEAVKLIWQMDMVNELETFTPKLNDKGEQIIGNDGKPVLEKTGGCSCHTEGNEVIVEDPTKRNSWKPYSVGAFLRLNPKHAAEQGGSFAALKATEKRPPKTPVTPGTPALNSVQTPDTMDKVGVLLHSYLDKCMVNPGSVDYAALLRHLTGDSGKQSILTLGGIMEDIQKIFRMDAIRAVYDTEKAKVPKAA